MDVGTRNDDGMYTSVASLDLIQPLSKSEDLDMTLYDAIDSNDNQFTDQSSRYVTLKRDQQLGSLYEEHSLTRRDGFISHSGFPQEAIDHQSPNESQIMTPTSASASMQHNVLKFEDYIRS